MGVVWKGVGHQLVFGDRIKARWKLGRTHDESHALRLDDDLRTALFKGEFLVVRWHS